LTAVRVLYRPRRRSRILRQMNGAAKMARRLSKVFMVSSRTSLYVSGYVPTPNELRAHPSCQVVLLAAGLLRRGLSPTSG
jgi:hypothetical protein